MQNSIYIRITAGSLVLFVVVLTSYYFVVDSQNIISRDKIGKFAIVPCNSTSNLYANPATIYFTFTLTAYNSSCKPVNCADWVKKLQKQKSDVNSLDIELDFGSGKYFAFLRLAFKDNGILEVPFRKSILISSKPVLGI